MLSTESSSEATSSGNYDGSSKYYEGKQARKDMRAQKFQNRLQRSIAIDLKQRRLQAPMGI